MTEMLLAIAEVLEAGAKHSRGWCLNTNRQQEAEVLTVMAKKARELAERSAQ